MPFLRRFAAWLVLISLIVTQSVALLEARHDDGLRTLADDTACLGPSTNTAGSHHEAGTQFENPLPAQPLDHCAFCHLQRAFGNARPGSFSSIFLAPLSAAVTLDTALALAPGVRHAFSPRGPPVSL
jgi:hypothetical protein